MSLRLTWDQANARWPGLLTRTRTLSVSVRTRAVKFLLIKSKKIILLFVLKSCPGLLSVSCTFLCEPFKSDSPELLAACQLPFYPKFHAFMSMPQRFLEIQQCTFHIPLNHSAPVKSFGTRSCEELKLNLTSSSLHCRTRRYERSCLCYWKANIPGRNPRSRLCNRQGKALFAGTNIFNVTSSLVFSESLFVV